MVVLGFGVLILLVGGLLLLRLFKSLEPKQRVVLGVVVVTGVAYLATVGIQAYRVAAEYRQQHEGR